MKDFRGMKRQRSRSNRKPAGNSNNPNRAYESNGPEGTKVRGNAQTIYEKYQQLARDANSSGDRVLAENHLQHAEHYFRMIRQMQPTRPVSEFVQRDPFSNGFDDYDDEMDNDGNDDENTVVGPEDPQPSFDEPRYENRDNGNNRDRNNNRDRDNRNNRDRDNNRNFKDRDNREPRNNEPRNEQRSFEPRNNNQPRDNAPRDNAPRDNDPQFDENGNRRETRRERYERRRQQRFAEQEQIVSAPASLAPSEDAYIAPAFIASTQPLGAPPRPTQVESAPEPTADAAPVREKRERKQRSNASADAAQLPAFLHRPTPVSAEPAASVAEEAPAKPKRAPRKRKEDASASEEA
ncbi:hypothetical protein ABENE_04895 [Asticcacaulis benevestitus DSM 16100 = ATCC BAA-896]|uniref:DUF4167 domain-containing protein n=2 Tax=Asticcacaulis TaxID=76890 RepID=V4PI83_9CAUL|nr:hypothetical protein ABENE_04895 [Asticcacaulis benevestitus DSM 16100 = ATCC BAA-896]